MATQADVRKIALSLAGVTQQPNYFLFSVENKGKQKNICWVWRERVDPKKARVPNPAVLGVRVADEIEKATLLGADTDKFFTEPHYNGYPAVLVRLANVTVPELRQLITHAWDLMAPKPKAEKKATPSKKRVTAAAKKPAAKRGTNRRG